MRSRTVGTAAIVALCLMLVVAIMLLAVLGTVVSTGIIRTLQVSRQDASRTAAVQDSQKALERISREIRVADPIVAADSNHLQLDVYRGGNCLRFDWIVSGTNLLQRQLTYTGKAAGACPAVGATANSDSGSRVFLTRLNTGSSIFTYYNAAGTAIPAPVSAASLSSIRRVTVSLSQTQSEGRAGTSVQTSVDLRNSH